MSRLRFATFTDDELKIEVIVDKSARTIQILDTGLGMTAEEVEKYIAQLAFSGAEEFLSKYKEAAESIPPDIPITIFSIFCFLKVFLMNRTIFLFSN